MKIAHFLVLLTLLFVSDRPLHAQGGGGRGNAPSPPLTPRAGAPIDITGYWVSLVTQDWRFRMFTPPKGDFTGIPLNEEGRKVGNAWDPAKDEATGEQCKAYGPGGIMRVPGRLHITWQDDTTLKVETDAGTQTRDFGFSPSQRAGGEWQGASVASWDRAASVMAGPDGRAFGGGGPPRPARGGSLKVVTSKMKPGYLRKNGPPYSSSAVITEYWDRLDVPNGDSLLLVATEVVDPTYLIRPFWTSVTFKRQPDGSGWNPTPCSAR